MWLTGTEGVQLSHKNAAALGTLFAIASSSEHLLAGGWSIVLGTINCLDCILAAPRTVSSASQVYLTSPCDSRHLHCRVIVVCSMHCNESTNGDQASQPCMMGCIHRAGGSGAHTEWADGS